MEQLESHNMIYTTAAACCLHNICIAENDAIDFFDDDAVNVPVPAVTNRIFLNNTRESGVHKRNTVMALL